MSQEGMLVWSSFVIESAGIGSSGPVAISGTQSAGDIAEMKIKAFGREVVLKKADLDALKGVSMNGIQLSYEGGYEELGGRTLYMKMLSGWVSRLRSAKVLVINERGDIRFNEAERG